MANTSAKKKKKKPEIVRSWERFQREESPFNDYLVELEIQDSTLSSSGLQSFLEHSLARALSQEQNKAVKIKVRKIQ